MSRNSLREAEENSHHQIPTLIERELAEAAANAENRATGLDRPVVGRSLPGGKCREASIDETCADTTQAVRRQSAW
ncbi:hypothetical protein [Rhodococcus erythropolis]|uniref:hypothetical protein n=1 Tax=Rhodococcus erythropolis TaxID=1833 RepID=UPI0030136C41